MFNVGLIDSLKLRIERDKIEIIDNSLIMPYYKFYPDSYTFQISMNDAEPFTKVINGITYRYYFKCYPNKNKVLQEYLVLQVSAKMLKERYFEGITKDNWKLILNDINCQYVVKISEKVFLDALVSDIDICINQLIDIKSYTNALNLLENYPKQSCKPLIKRFETKKNGHIINLGLDFNKREKAVNTKPYIKIYHKGFELQNHSTVFYATYLMNNGRNSQKSFIDNLVRYEFTIKAYDHKKYLKEQNLLNSELKTFNDLINLPKKELTQIAKSGLPHYCEKAKKPKQIKDLNPIDNLLLYYMQQLIYKGQDRDHLKAPIDSITCPVTKSRMKTKINTLLTHLEHENIDLKIRLESNERSNKFLSSLGF